MTVKSKAGKEDRRKAKALPYSLDLESCGRGHYLTALSRITRIRILVYKTVAPLSLKVQAPTSISVQEGLSPNDSRDLHIASSGRKKSRIGANPRVVRSSLPLYHTEG